MIKKIIIVVVTIVCLGAIIPGLWPMMMDTQGVVGNMTGTDPGTLFVKAMWPVALIIIGIGIAAAVIFFGLKKLGVFGGKKR